MRQFIGLLFSFAAVGLLTSGAWAADGDSIELSVPIQDGSYDVREFYSQCNEKLGWHVPLERIPSRQVKLTGVERAAILAAQELGLLDVRFASDRLTLVISNSESDAVRRRRQQQLEDLLGLAAFAWPEGAGLQLPAGFAPTARTVLLLHGLEGNRQGFRRLRAACTRAEIQVLEFEYPNDGPLAWSGDRLSVELGYLAEKHPQHRLVMIGHSMGGLVARFCLETPGKNPRCVTDLFLLGTPNEGSRLADLQPWAELWFQVLGRSPSGWTTINDGLGEAAVDLRPNSQFLRRLNSQRRPSDVRYHVGIGRKGLLSRQQRPEIERELLELFQRRRTPLPDRKRLLPLVQAPELCSEEGDGAVCVRSAQLARATTERQFDLTHWELISPSEDPARSETLEWILETMSWAEIEP